MAEPIDYGAAVERWYPIALGLLAGAAYVCVPASRDYVMPETITNLLSAIVTVGGVAIGFLATVKSILISIDDRPIIKRIRDANLYGRVIAYLQSAIFWSFALTILSAVALVADYRELQSWDRIHQAGTAVIIGCSVTALLSYHRIARIWASILNKIDAKQI